MKKFLGRCASAKKVYSELKEIDCCRSCIYEQNSGYGYPIEVETEDGYFELCCRCSATLRKILGKQYDWENRDLNTGVIG